MRAFEFLKEAESAAPKKVGREFNHLEDLVFTEPNGGARAVAILKNIAQDAKDISVKWDGAPTVLWGREPNGQFRLVGKNNWGREEGMSNSPKELQQFIMSRGKGEDWRAKFASDMEHYGRCLKQRLHKISVAMSMPTYYSTLANQHNHRQANWCSHQIKQPIQ